MSDRKEVTITMPVEDAEFLAKALSVLAVCADAPSTPGAAVNMAGPWARARKAVLERLEAELYKAIADR